MCLDLEYLYPIFGKSKPWTKAKLKKILSLGPWAPVRGRLNVCEWINPDGWDGHLTDGRSEGTWQEASFPLIILSGI